MIEFSCAGVIIIMIFCVLKRVDEQYMEIKEYKTYSEADIMRLYTSAGWTTYTAHPKLIREGFENSLLILGSYEAKQLLGIIRVICFSNRCKTWRTCSRTLF